MKSRIGFSQIIFIVIIGTVGYLLFHPEIWFPAPAKNVAEEKSKPVKTSQWSNLNQVPAAVLAVRPVFNYSIDCRPRIPVALSFFNGKLFIAYQQLNMVDVLDYHGNRQGFFDPLPQDKLQIIALTHDMDGNLYLVDGKSKTILKFNKDNQFVSLFPNLPTSEDSAKHLQMPAGLFIRDNLTVVADIGSRAIKTYLLNGEFVMSISGTGPGSINKAWHPVNAAITDDGRILVSDIRNKTISAFSCAGKFAYDFDLSDEVKLSAPGAFAIDSLGRVYVIDGALNRLIVYDNFGHYLYSMTLNNKDNGRLSLSDGIAIDKEKRRIFMADTKNQQIEAWKY